MIGVTALAYTLVHVVIYFALRFWNFGFIVNETATRLTLIVATLSTIGLIILIAVGLDVWRARIGRGLARLTGQNT